jgi:hypothetical protein
MTEGIGNESQKHFGWPARDRVLGEGEVYPKKKSFPLLAEDD